jgi:hypothetical protein
LLGQGKRYMDDLRGITERIERDERALLKQRETETEASASRARARLGIGTLLCMILSVSVGVFLSRSLMGPVGSAVRYSGIARRRQASKLPRYMFRSSPVNIRPPGPVVIDALTTLPV